MTIQKPDIKNIRFLNDQIPTVSNYFGIQILTVVCYLDLHCTHLINCHVIGQNVIADEKLEPMSRPVHPFPERARERVVGPLVAHVIVGAARVLVLGLTVSAAY